MCQDTSKQACNNSLQSSARHAGLHKRRWQPWKQVRVLDHVTYCQAYTARPSYTGAMTMQRSQSCNSPLLSQMCMTSRDLCCAGQTMDASDAACAGAANAEFEQLQGMLSATLDRLPALRQVNGWHIAQLTLSWIQCWVLLYLVQLCIAYIC